jgi:hypothetical protein
MPRTLAAVLAVLALSAGAAPATASASSRSCGTIRFADGARVHAELRGRAACRTARRVLRRYLVSHAPCSGSACVRGHLGWTCATASPYAFPRLASCSRRGTVATAYSLAD